MYENRKKKKNNLGGPQLWPPLYSGRHNPLTCHFYHGCKRPVVTSDMEASVQANPFKLIVFLKFFGVEWLVAS